MEENYRQQGIHFHLGRVITIRRWRWRERNMYNILHVAFYMTQNGTHRIHTYK